jgi:hypothetical protein
VREPCWEPDGLVDQLRIDNPQASHSFEYMVRLKREWCSSSLAGPIALSRKRSTLAIPSTRSAQQAATAKRCP